MKPLKFSDLKIPVVKEAMKKLYDGKKIDQAEVIADIAKAIGKAWTSVSPKS